MKASETLAPVILQFNGNQSYVVRQVTLLQMATDRISNVKFMVAKT
jgi:hypothetical protein